MIKETVDDLGGPTRVARAIGVSRSRVHAVIKAGKFPDGWREKLAALAVRHGIASPTDALYRVDRSKRDTIDIRVPVIIWEDRFWAAAGAESYDSAEMIDMAEVACGRTFSERATIVWLEASIPAPRPIKARVK